MQFIGAILWVLGLIATVKSLGWAYLLAFIPLYFLFTYFLGVPAAINILRTWSMFDKVLVRLVVQLVFAALMVIILNAIGMKEFIAFFIVGGVVNAFAMPKASLIQERRELQSN